MSSLEFRDLSVTYGDRHALAPVTDRVESGEWVGLIGPNGAGKSSLLRAVAGLVACGGDVLVEETSLGGLHDRERATQVAYVAQSPLIPDDMTTFDYVLLGRTPYITYFGTDTLHDREVTGAVIDRLALGEFAGRYLGSMSGGERQRVVLARALAQEAPVLLLDEPTSALDIGHQQQALELVSELREHSGLTVVSAMHDLTLAGTYTDRLLMLDEGVVVARGVAAEVITAERLRAVFDVRATVEVDPDDGGVIVIPRPRRAAVADERLSVPPTADPSYHRGMDESSYPEFPGVEPFDAVRSPDDERVHRKRMCALGYRIFAAMRWGQLGDGHVSARDPILHDHFWLLDWGVPFGEATVDQLVLVGPDGRVMDADGNPTGAVNTAGFNIHAPILAARPDAVSAAHTHTSFGTPWSANVEPFRALSQESCSFVFDQALFDDEEVEVLSYDGGKRIATALGDKKFCILRNHGSLTVGGSVEEAVGWFVMSERVAEVHVKAPDGRPISDDAAAIAAASMQPAVTGWRVFQWLRRTVVPDPAVVG